jgi:hypothetical protein
MSIWDDKFWVVGDRVRIILGNYIGCIRSITYDDRNELLITVHLDDSTVTPDGVYLVRDFEITRS